MLRKILSDRSFKFSFLYTFVFLGTGLLFLHLGWADYGWLLFVFLPILLGISIGALPNKKWASYGGFISLIIFCFLILVGAVEGFICVLMALPFIVPLIFLGSIVSHLFQRYKILKSSDKFLVLMLPLLFFVVGAPIEKSISSNDKPIIEVESQILLPYTPEQVYDAIKSVDTLDAEKPFLMHLDLPIPQKCVLEREDVGALRTCYFEGGKIVERVTELERGKILKMDVIEYELTGRKWLGFEEAIYLFEETAPNQCLMTRITTYSSELKPRFYWQPLEEWGIEQEHQYVFNNLVKDLKAHE